EISLASGKMVAEHLPKDRYEVVLLDPLALMVGNARLSSAMRDKAKALIAKGGIIEALPERDKALPAHHVAQKRPSAHREHQLLRINFSLRRSLAFLILGIRRGRKSGEIMRPHKSRCGGAHRVFIQWKGIVQHIPPKRRRHHFSAV